MYQNHKKWLIKELGILAEKNVITEETVSSIKKYYDEQEAIAHNKISHIVSIIAGLLIAGGIISLIAYNFYFIPRIVKTIMAFFIALSSPLVYFIYIQKHDDLKIKEILSVLWSLLFCAAVAFLSQIYKLPSSPEKFILVCTISSVLITYATSSLGALILTAVQGIILTVLLPSYLVFILPLALLPLVYKKKYGRMLFVLYFALQYIIITTGLTISFVGITSFSAFMLMQSEKEKNKILSICGKCIFTVLMLFIYDTSVFYITGKEYSYLNEIYFLKTNSLIDIIIALVFLAFSCYFIIKNLNIINILCIVAGIYSALITIIKIDAVRKILAVFGIIIYTLLFVYGLANYFLQIHKNEKEAKENLIFCSLPCLYAFMQIMDCPSLFLFTILFAFIAFYFLRQNDYLLMSIIFIIVFISYNKNLADFFINLAFYSKLNFFLSAITVLSFIFYEILKKGQRKYISIAVYCLITIIHIFTMSKINNIIISRIFLVLTIICTHMIMFESVYNAMKDNNKKRIILCVICWIIIIQSDFLLRSSNLIIKGIGFIISGLLIFIVNLLMRKKKNESGKIENAESCKTE